MCVYGGMGEESKPNLKQKQNKKLFLREGGGGLRRLELLNFFTKNLNQKKSRTFKCDLDLQPM